MSMADHTEPLQITPDPEALHAFHRQQLSAMLDGELSPDEAKFMLRRLEHDVELAQCWERWQRCGELLRGRGDRLLPADFAARVAASVQAPVARVSSMAGHAPRRSRRVMAWGGMGLAASLALAVGLVVMWPADESGLPVPVATRDAPVVVGESGAALAATASAEAQVRLPEPALAAVTPSRAEHAARELLAPAAVAPVPVLPRPWPRAGIGGGAFNVGYGSPMRADPFLPRWTPPPSALWPEPVPVQGDARRD